MALLSFERKYRVRGGTLLPINMGALAYVDGVHSTKSCQATPASARTSAASPASSSSSIRCAESASTVVPGSLQLIGYDPEHLGGGLARFASLAPAVTVNCGVPNGFGIVRSDRNGTGCCDLPTSVQNCSP